MVIGVTEFRVWAPRARRVQISLDNSVRELRARSGGWWSAEFDARPDAEYAFLLDDDPTPLPDPASRWQPYGVHGVSRRYDQSAFGWTDQQWAGRQLAGGVVYELHIGTFTPGATFASAIERLDHLSTLGVTHVEVLPVNGVNGKWNWGYDGVDWYAVHEPYGGPDGLKAFVDACHSRGLAVVLDVVYNHLGPSGNYLPRFGPYLKTGRNLWGEAINLDGPESGPVRRYVLDNALMWLADFHIDALRLDAVHALEDKSTPHILEQLSAEVDALSTHLGRPLTLIAESDLNDPIVITAREAGGRGLDAQWDDDVHHALHALLTGERHAYYVDFGSLAVLAKVLTSAFLHDGTYSTFRDRNHGRHVDRAHIPGHRFIAFLQNHDQVGNRAAGDRLTELASDGRRRIGAMLLLSAPFTPMLWMGEEWSASTRWPFFSSHPEAELASAAREERMSEFASHGWDVAEVVDPQDSQTYERAKLDWSEIGQAEHEQMLEFYRAMIALRRREAELSDPRLDAVRVDYDDDAGWIAIHRGRLRVLANFAGNEQHLPLRAGELLLATGKVHVEAEFVRLAPETAAIVRIR